MKARSDEADYGVWRADGCAFAVEYPPQLLEELRGFAEQGYKRIPHGGVEVGALLLGSVDGDRIRLTTWRAIDCEHARGPGFVMSQNDLAGLASLLEETATDRVLADLRPVGWFHSHTRSGLFLSEEDIAVHHRYFPEPWQTAMVMVMTKDQPAKAGFFFRDASAAIDGRASLLEFVVQPNPAILAGAKRKTAAAPKRDVTAKVASSLAGARPDTRGPGACPPSFGSAGEALPPPVLKVEAPPDQPAPALLLDEPPKFGFWRRLLAVVAVAVALALAGIVTRPLWMPSAMSTLALRVDELDDQLIIRWDHNAPQVRRANRAVLTITDGDTQKQITLNAEEARHGTVTYPRSSGDVQVKLTMYEGGTPTLQEFTRYLGQLPEQEGQSTPRSVEELRADRDRLELALSEERARAQKLRGAARDLQSRVARERERASNQTSDRK